MNRRAFLRSSAIIAALAPVSHAVAAEPKSATAPTSASTANPKPRHALEKGLMFATFPAATLERLSVKERFQLAHDAGYDGWLISEQGYRAPGATEVQWLANVSAKMDQILAL